MNRARLPLRFTLLWVVNMAVIVALEIIFGLSEKFSFTQRDMESVYCIIGAVLSSIELTIWNYVSDKIKKNDP